ncbi:YueH family protein [Fictibacillus nanhaiensis]|uniref:YueH family protein n=1 Tax=Fictibacillus nanhaiensis TaxID=742169 RepID=UPI002E23D4B6|nr:YueH family protein [Fictibacillus nanhaiensis]
MKGRISIITTSKVLTISGNKSSEVFLHKTSDKRFIVAIPDLHWSAEFKDIDHIAIQKEHLNNSLNFHLFSGDTEELVDSIISIVERTRFE